MCTGNMERKKQIRGFISETKIDDRNTLLYNMLYYLQIYK
jgi:hypothetical protein